MSRVKIPSVTTSMRVLRDTLEPKRTRSPTVSPTLSFKVAAIRSAAARAASLRGSSTRIFLSAAHGSSISTSGTRVVLPAPGGATSTACVALPQCGGQCRQRVVDRQAFGKRDHSGGILCLKRQRNQHVPCVGN